MSMFPVTLKNDGKFAQNRLLKNLLEKKANYLLRVLNTTTLASMSKINNFVTVLYCFISYNHSSRYSDNALYVYATNTEVTSKTENNFTISHTRSLFLCVSALFSDTSRK